MKRQIFSMLMVFGACIGSQGCADTGQDRVQFPLYVAGTELTGPVIARGDIPVTVDVADAAFGALYLCAGTTAGELCETARAEWLETTIVDAMVPTPVSAGTIGGTTGPVRSWMYDHAISSQLTRKAPYILEAAHDLGDTSIVIAGRALVDTIELPFSVSVPIQQSDETERGVPVVRKSTSDVFFRDIAADEAGLVVRFNAAIWVQDMDFRPYVTRDGCSSGGPIVVCDGLLERTCDDATEVSSRQCGATGDICVPGQGCAERLIITEDSQAYRSVRNAVVSGERPSFEWGYAP